MPVFYKAVTKKAYRRMFLPFFLAAILAGAAAGCGSNGDTKKSSREAPDPEQTYQGTIAAVGDSLTAGQGVDEANAYPALLEKRLAADGFHFKVVNAGISGETSSGLLSRIDWVLSALKPDIVILETGANDGLRGIDPARLEENLDAIVSTLKTNKVEVVFTGMQMLPNLGPEYTRAFSRIYPRIAEKYDLVFMPFFLQDVAGRTDLNQADGIHPTAQGYERIVENLYPFVRKAVTAYLSRRNP